MVSGIVAAIDQEAAKGLRRTVEGQAVGADGVDLQPLAGRDIGVHRGDVVVERPPAG